VRSPCGVAPSIVRRCDSCVTSGILLDSSRGWPLGLWHSGQWSAVRRGHDVVIGDEASALAPAHDLQIAVAGFDDGRATFHPIPPIEIMDAAKRPIGGVMNVSADHAIEAAAPGLIRHGFFKGSDESHRSLDAVLQVGGQRPIAETKVTAAPVQGMIEPKGELRAAVTQNGEPTRSADHDIEFVAVQYAIAPAFGAGVHGVAADFDAAEAQANVVAQTLVVIARNQHQANALAHLAQEFLHDVVVSLRPVRPAPHFPEIDDIADEINDLRLVVLEKFEQI